jgi:hypothetical protein
MRLGGVWRHLRDVQAKRNGAVGADAIRHEIGQQQLCRIERRAADERVALVDQVEDRTDKQGDEQRAFRHSVRHRIPPDFARHHQKPVSGTAAIVNPVVDGGDGRTAAVERSFSATPIPRQCRKRESQWDGITPIDFAGRRAYGRCGIRRDPLIGGGVAEWLKAAVC